MERRRVFGKVPGVCPKDSGKNSTYCTSTGSRCLSSTSLVPNPQSNQSWPVGIVRIPPWSGLTSSSIILQIRIPSIPGKGSATTPKMEQALCRTLRSREDTMKGNLTDLVVI